eukprot:740395-Prymnesium_polylepis.1
MLRIAIAIAAVTQVQHNGGRIKILREVQTIGWRLVGLAPCGQQQLCTARLKPKLTRVVQRGRACPGRNQLLHTPYARQLPMIQPQHDGIQTRHPKWVHKDHDECVGLPELVRPRVAVDRQVALQVPRTVIKRDAAVELDDHVVSAILRWLLDGDDRCSPPPTQLDVLAEHACTQGNGERLKGASCASKGDEAVHVGAGDARDGRHKTGKAQRGSEHRRPSHPLGKKPSRLQDCVAIGPDRWAACHGPTAVSPAG